MQSRTKNLLWFFFFANVSFSAIYRPVTPQALDLAIIAANASAEDDIIDLQGNVFTFTSECDITDDTINNDSCSDVNALPVIASAGGSGRLAIVNGVIERDNDPDDDGDTSDADFFRLIEVAAGGNLTLFNIALANGSATDLSAQVSPPPPPFRRRPHILEVISDDGGAIYNAGQLDIQNGTVANSTADESGGGIYNAQGASIAIQSSNINRNIARNNEDIANNEGGGAIFNAGVIETISHSTIANNDSKGNGGGLNNHGEAHHIIRSSISTNFTCSVDVVGSICSDPTAGNGGGIYNAASACLLQLTNVTIAENAALEGGGIFNLWGDAGMRIMDIIPSHSSGVYIYNSTIASNTANDGGGGIYNSDTGPAFINETVSTIIADNIDNDAVADADYSPDIYDGLGNDVGLKQHNLIGNNSGALSTFINSVNNNIVGTNPAPVDPKLKPLDPNHEGFTSVMELLPGSPAINRGLNPYALIHDQRGTFARVRCSRPDIGAFELQRCF